MTLPDIFTLARYGFQALKRSLENQGMVLQLLHTVVSGSAEDQTLDLLSMGEGNPEFNLYIIWDQGNKISIFQQKITCFIKQALEKNTGFPSCTLSS